MTSRIAACLFAGALLIGVPLQASAQDWIDYNRPLPARPGEASIVKALLIGWYPTFGGWYVAPYFVVKLDGQDAILQVFADRHTTLDGVDFYCPSDHGPTDLKDGICARVPVTLAVRLPALVELRLRYTRMETNGHPVAATDMITTILSEPRTAH